MEDPFLRDRQDRCVIRNADCHVYCPSDLCGISETVRGFNHGNRLIMIIYFNLDHRFEGTQEWLTQ